MKRRVQAFVLVAIAVFVAGGFAARSFWASAERHAPAPAATPARDFAVVPSPEDTAVRPPASARPSSTAPPALRPRAGAKATPARSARLDAARPAAAAVPAKVITAEDAAVRLTNLQRAQHGCVALRVDPRLRAAARAHSADMHRNHYFDHNAPDGRTPWDRIKAAGYTTPGAENIAEGYATAQAVLQGWMDSPGHRANILNCSLKAVGIGVEFGPGGPWWTQDFGYK